MSSKFEIRLYKIETMNKVLTMTEKIPLYKFTNHQQLLSSAKSNFLMLSICACKSLGRQICNDFYIIWPLKTNSNMIGNVFQPDA